MSLVRLRSLGLREGVGWQSLLLGLYDGHVVGERPLGSNLAGGIPGQHNLDLDSQDALSEENVSAGHVHVLVDGISGVDHQTVNKLHGLGSLSAQLVAERLGLSDGAQTTSGHLLSVQLNGTLGEVESLLNDAGQLTDPSALLSQHVLSAGGHDDDLSTGGSHADLHTGVPILGQLTGQKLVQLGFENSVSDELPLLGDLCRHTLLLLSH